MNERIKKLLKQAGFTVMRGHGLKETVPEDVFIANVCVSNETKKLAELIVREVFAKIEDERFEIYQPVKESVMKHFGVE
jgi:hypothetical protein